VWLTVKQIKLIWPGLHLLSTNFFKFEEKSISYLSPWGPSGTVQNYDEGEWNRELMDRILALGRHLEKKSKSGGYVRMDFLDLRIAVFAARTSVHVVRQNARTFRKWNKAAKARFRFDQASIVELKSKTKLVIHSLERHLKRATRLFLRAHSRAEFERKAHEWARFLRWVKYHLTFFAKEPARQPGLRKYYQTMINHMCGIAGGVLLNDGYEQPDARDLRRAVRTYIRYARRERSAWWDFSTLIRYPGDSAARYRLLEFLEKHLTLKDCENRNARESR